MVPAVALVVLMVLVLLADWAPLVVVCLLWLLLLMVVVVGATLVLTLFAATLTVVGRPVVVTGEDRVVGSDAGVLLGPSTFVAAT